MREAPTAGLGLPVARDNAPPAQPRDDVTVD